MKHSKLLVLPFLLISAVAMFSLIAAACGDDDDDGGGATTVPGGPQAIKVVAKDFKFDPDEFKLKVGTGGGAAGSVNVTFSNQGSAQHSFSLYTDEEFKNKVPGAEIAPAAGGGGGSSVFVAPTTKTDLYFRCEIHPTQMKGEIAFE